MFFVVEEVGGEKGKGSGESAERGGDGSPEGGGETGIGGGEERREGGQSSWNGKADEDCWQGSFKEIFLQDIQAWLGLKIFIQIL